jgi:alkanesulfonate monooxygenase SsuD/methylene tetrahydromethanopterin reductase-like flavin-dependent oxidoreductase (luciferase family)
VKYNVEVHMPVRIQAADLREATRKASAARAELAARGEDPTVYLDIEVVIDRHAAAAFEVADTRGAGVAPASVRYIGTPRGLVGMIADVQRLGIADGVVLVTRDEHHVVALMLDEMSAGLAQAM